jgi:hypothetical protein
MNPRQISLIGTQAYAVYKASEAVLIEVKKMERPDIPFSMRINDVSAGENFENFMTLARDLKLLLRPVKSRKPAPSPKIKPAKGVRKKHARN